MPAEIAKSVPVMQKDQWIWDMPGLHQGQEAVARLLKDTENQNVCFQLFFLVSLKAMICSCLCL